MCKRNNVFMVCLSLVIFGIAQGAEVILNEYNAVASDMYLNGGTASVDLSGGQASDSYFGRVLGNGGDWFELVVIADHLDMRNWKFDLYEDSVFLETLELTGHSIWSDLRSGTIITVSEDQPSDISYNPAAGDWWINVQANNAAPGTYITASNFAVNNSNWQLTIRNAGGSDIFGPAGEGISPISGISDSEIFRLETTPGGFVTPDSPDYDDGDNLSTFGTANQWGIQELAQLRTVVASPSSLSLSSPNGSEIFMGGTQQTILWSYTGTIAAVGIEFSLDDGYSWSAVYPPNTGNSGSYDWLMPIVDSQQCRVRVRNLADLSVFDASSNTFTIYECTLAGDLTGDCTVNIDDFAIMASCWLEDANPYN